MRPRLINPRRSNLKSLDKVNAWKIALLGQILAQIRLRRWKNLFTRWIKRTLRNFMINNATQTIDKLIENAINEKEINFGQGNLEIPLEENGGEGVQNSDLGVIINSEEDKNTQTLEVEWKKYYY